MAFTKGNRFHLKHNNFFVSGISQFLVLAEPVTPPHLSRHSHANCCRRVQWSFPLFVILCGYVEVKHLNVPTNIR